MVSDMTTEQINRGVSATGRPNVGAPLRLPDQAFHLAAIPARQHGLVSMLYYLKTLGFSSLILI